MVHELIQVAESLVRMSTIVSSKLGEHDRTEAAHELRKIADQVRSMADGIAVQGWAAPYDNQRLRQDRLVIERERVYRAMQDLAVDGVFSRKMKDVSRCTGLYKNNIKDAVDWLVQSGKLVVVDGQVEGERKRTFKIC